MQQPPLLGLHRRRAARGVLGAAVVLALVMSGCAGGERTAYCQPENPVVAPLRVVPGDELHVEIVEARDGVGCESRLPTGASYEVSIRSEEPAVDPDDGRWSASLGILDPSSDGVAEGTFDVPGDVPTGPAWISVDLQGADTVCDIDPSIGCAPNPFAPIVVVG